MLLLLTVILSCALCSRPFVGAYETRLINKLLLNYDKRIRPVKNSSHAVEVTIEPQIYSLIDVDELHEILKILLWLPQGWTDENLSWEPSEWDNITLVNVPASELWMPDGYIFNTIEIREALSLSQIYARVDFNGMVEVDLSKVISVRCPLDLISFPFDTQNCSLQFGSWGYQAHQLTHIVRNTFVLVNNQNSEWDIVSFSAKKTKTWYKSMHNQSRQFEEIFYTLSIKRKPLYYIVVLVVPSFLIANICLVGLFTPNSANGEREEKVTLGLTTLLTMAVVLNIVAGEMPKSSTGLPLLGRYILIEIIICTSAIMVSVIIMFIHQRLLSYNSLPPDWLVALLRTGRQRNKAIRRSADNLLDRNSAHLPLFAPRNSRLDATDTDRSETAIDLHRCLELLNEVNHQLAEQKVTQRNELMWRRIFDKIDLTAGAIFLVLNCSVTFYAFFWVAGGLY